MTKVYCDLDTCEYWKKDDANGGICDMDEINLIDGERGSYVAHTWLAPEYQETFWKRLTSKADQHECRTTARGKRYEMIGLVWFTDQDDRWGIEDISFTEKRSGLRCLGKDINDEHAEVIRKKVRAVSPVEALPEAEPNDLWGRRKR